MAQYPTSAAGDQHLYVAVNNRSTVLDGALGASGDNTGGGGISVVSTTGFPTTGFISIGTEAISYTGISVYLTLPVFTGITRGADGTTAASHNHGDTVRHAVIAAHHNATKEEVKAIENDLIAVKAALNDADTPASTASDVKDRFDQVVSQLKRLSEKTNWYDAPVSLLNYPQNQLINGNFNIWQRGTSVSPSAGAQYTADGWQVNNNAVPTLTVSQDAGYRTGSYSLKWDLTALNGASVLNLRQSTYDIGNMVGQTVTVSAKVKTSQSSLVTIQIIDSLGTTSGTTHSGSGSWETLTATRTLSTSISGYVRINFAVTNTSTSTFYVSDTVMVYGNVAPAFIPETRDIELMRCQRHYEVSGTITPIMPIQRPSTNNYFSHTVQFKTTKRTTPTLTLTKSTVNMQHLPTTGAALVDDSGNWTLSSSGISTEEFSLNATRSSDQTTYPLVGFIGTWTAEA